MPWYKAGTVSCTQNSNAVIGAGTAFIANARVGDAFRGPDGGWYEVTNIASDTAMSISPNYQGATNAAGIYALAPMQGYVKDSADALRALVNQFGSQLAALADTDGLSEGATNKYFTDARVRAAVLAGLDITSGAPIAATDTLLAAFGKLQAQVTARLPTAGGKMAGAINDATPVALVSAATVDIGAAVSNVVTISGTTAITGLGTIAAGARRTVRFLAALVLTHNATSLILPASANITTAANDTAEFLSLGSGNWFCIRFTPFSGLVVSPSVKNLFLNPIGAINQRGYVSGTATTAASQFAVDRMKVVVSGQSLGLAPSGIGFVMTAPMGGVEQVIEGSTVEGGIYTLSWTGTATATVNGSPISNKGQTSSLPAGVNVIIRFTGGTYTAVQLEFGLVASPLEKRPNQLELFMCQRYARQHELNAFGYVQAGIGPNDLSFPLAPPMRAAPTLTIVSPITIFDGGTGGNTIVGVIANQSSATCVRFRPSTSGPGFTTASLPLITYGGSILVSADI